MLPTDCHRRFDCHLCFFGASIFHCEPAATFIVKMPVHVRLDLTPPQHGEPLSFVSDYGILTFFCLRTKQAPGEMGHHVKSNKFHRLRGQVNTAGAEVPLEG